jgi:protein tyrosine phosphatase
VNPVERPHSRESSAEDDGSSGEDDAADDAAIAEWLEGDSAVSECASFGRICDQQDPRPAKEAYPTALDAKNKGKNRYRGVYAEEATRVPAGRGGLIYINANFVWGCKPRDRCFISTQAPLPNTIGDFWLMCYEQRSPVVVMLTRLVENARQKAHLYWPVELNHPRTWGGVRVTVLAFFQENALQVRKIRLELVGQDSAPAREVHHVQYTDWPDFDVPASTRGIRKTMTLMQRLRRDAVEEADGNQEAVGPTVVHCSAGIGRSGTLIAAALLDEDLACGVPLAELDVPETVAAMRTQRAGCVQTPGQFTFLRRLLADRARYWNRVRRLGGVDVVLGLDCGANTDLSDSTDASEYDSFPEDTDAFSSAAGSVRSRSRSEDLQKS